MGDQDMKALDAIWHAPRRDARDFLHLGDGVSALQVSLMRRSISLCELVV
jgi:hypothetical protein